MLPVSTLSRPSHCLLLLSSIFLLCNSPTLPNLLLHSHSPSSTSSPHVQNTWVSEISRWASCKSGRGGVPCESGREGEGHSNDRHRGLETPWLLSFTLKPLLQFHGQTSCFAKWFWLVASLVRIQRKYIKQIIKLHKWGSEKKKSQIIFNGKRKCLEKDLEQTSNQDLNS